jgi:hypothetical protein
MMREPSNHGGCGDDIASRVANWLSGQGYPLELRIARVFESTGAAVVQSDYYADPETGRLREIDIRAEVSGVSASGRTRFRSVFVVECKSSQKPWVVFTRRDRIPLDEYGGLDNVVMSQRSYGTLSEAASDPNTRSFELFKVADRPGYGFTQAFTSGEDKAFHALMSVTKAAVTIARFEGKRIRGSASEILELVVATPIVAVDAPLFECSLSSDGSLDLQRTDSAIVYWTAPTWVDGQPERMAVHIVSESGMEAFAHTWVEDSAMLMKRLGCSKAAHGQSSELPEQG